MAFSETLKELLAAQGMNQKELANAVQVSPASVCGWLQGAIPQADRLERVARVLNVSSEYLLGKTQNPVRANDPEQINALYSQILSRMDAQMEQFQSLDPAESGPEPKTGSPDTTPPTADSAYACAHCPVYMALLQTIAALAVQSPSPCAPCTVVQPAEGNRPASDHAAANARKPNRPVRFLRGLFAKARAAGSARLRPAARSARQNPDTPDRTNVSMSHSSPKATNQPKKPKGETQ